VLTDSILAGRGISLRVADEADAAFLRALFESARPDAMIIATWPDAVRKTFLDQQFRFQTIHYGRAYADADRLIIFEQGQPIGRMILSRAEADWCIVDIALMPSSRGRGVGTLLLRAIQDWAIRAEARGIWLTVDMGNSARRLYERMGFVTVEEEIPGITMAWRSTAQLKTA
jgi:GNAT superfamily N-acetyltransferase